MNTNRLKPFAQQARKLLMEGVKTRLLFWGFDEKKGMIEQPEEIPGGLIFRGEVYNDPSLFKKWLRLKSQIEQHSFKDVVEEAAYTWFNRLMAIKILEKNGYEEMTIGLNGTSPAILQNAIGGLMPFLNTYDRTRVQQFILDGKEDEAFGVLLTGFCRGHKLLNRVFGGINDFTELLLPINLLATDNVVDLLNKNGFIDENDYKEVELIGWLYQYYISDRKDEVFKGFKENKKARKEDIPAATQIFTPKWIVKYMVENTVGATWLEHYPESEIRESLKYLVENKANEAETVKDSISASEINLLDPAVGSGHILVTAFDLYMMMYKEEGFTTRQAVREILKNNLFGIDIDKRATQLARFAVLMKAAKYDAEILKEEALPQIFPMPEPFFFDRSMVEDFLFGIIKSEENSIEEPVINEVNSEITHELVLEFPEPYETLYAKAVNELSKALLLMLQAQNLGSTMVFELSDSTKKLIRLSYSTFKKNTIEAKLNIDQLSWWVTLQQYLDPLLILSSQYKCVVANPPYMGQKSMNEDLKSYINKNYIESKYDLFSVFVDVMMSNLTEKNGRMGCITMESWMFLSSYEPFRKKLISNFTISSLTHFGWHVLGIAFGTVQMIVRKEKCTIEFGEYSYMEIEDIDKSSNEPYLFPLHTKRYSIKSQFEFMQIPGTPIAYWLSDSMYRVFQKGRPLSDFGDTRQGMATSDNNKFLRLWYEVNFTSIGFNYSNREECKLMNPSWVPYNKGGEFRKWYGNQYYILNWKNDGEEVIGHAASLYGSATRTIKSISHYFKPCFSWSKVSGGDFALRYFPEGFVFDVAGCCVYFEDTKKAKYVSAILNSVVGKSILKILSPTLNYEAGAIAKFPIIIKEDLVDKVVELVESNISIAKDGWSSYEISWEFQTFSMLFIGSTLRESFIKYCNSISEKYFRLKRQEEELNRIAIQVYELSTELKAEIASSEVVLHDHEIDYSSIADDDSIDNEKVPILKADIVMQQLISYSIGCKMGRYKLNMPGLQITNSCPAPEKLSSYRINDLIFEIDEDSIIPLMDIDSPFSDNIVSVFKYFLQVIWGEETLTENINFVNTSLDMDVEKYLTEKFWDFHKKMYQKKPIYWLFTSPEGSFKVLTYMHRMDKFTVQKIRLNYLMRYIEFLRDKIQQAEANNEQGRAIDKLRKALADCLEYDKILKPLADQQITFDLDDGVTVNYEKFKGAVAPLR